MGALFQQALAFLVLIAATVAIDSAYASDDLPVIHLKTNYLVSETGATQAQSLTSLALPATKKEAHESFRWLAEQLAQDPQNHHAYQVVAYHEEGHELDPALIDSIPVTVPLITQTVKQGFFKKLKRGFKNKIQKAKNKTQLVKNLIALWGEDKWFRFLHSDRAYRSTFALIRGVGAWAVFNAGLQAGGTPSELAQWIAAYPAALSMTLQFKAQWWTDLLGRLKTVKKTLVKSASEYLYLIPPAVLLTALGFGPTDGGTLEVAKNINMAVLQTIFAQAPWDFATSDKKKFDLEHSPFNDHPFIHFKASMKLVGISMATIIGAALRLSGDEFTQGLGEFILVGLGATGFYNYVKVNLKHNEEWQRKLEWVIRKVPPKAHLKAVSCTELLLRARP